MSEDPIKLAIRAAMGKPQSTTGASKTQLAARGVQRSKTQVRVDMHGSKGDFTRSNSNPISRPVNNAASVGLEEVTRARLSRTHSKDNASGSLSAEYETILKAVRIAIDGTGGAPSKRAAKRAASPKMTRSDRVFQSGRGCGPGSSKSPEIDAIKAIASPETGCIVRKEGISEATSMKNANTTQGGYFPQIVE